MTIVAVIYHSSTGRTKSLAESVVRGSCEFFDGGLRVFWFDLCGSGRGGGLRRWGYFL